MLTSRIKIALRRTSSVIKNGLSTSKVAEEKFSNFQRFMSLANLLKPEGQLLFEKLKTEIGNIPMKDTVLWEIFTDLQNPLLVKYNFEKDLFLSGAKVAGEGYFNALISPEFKAHLEKESIGDKTFCIVPDSVDLINSTSSPNLLNVIKSTFKSVREQNLPITVTGINIKDACIIGVKTYPYYDTDWLTINFNLFANKSLYISKNVDFLAYPNEDESEIIEYKEPSMKELMDQVEMSELDDNYADFKQKMQIKLNQLDQIKYPNGSIQANVSVIYNTVVTYTDDTQIEAERNSADVVRSQTGAISTPPAVNVVNTNADATPTNETTAGTIADTTVESKIVTTSSSTSSSTSEKTNDSIGSIMEKSRNVWIKLIFSACISNQDELEWKVIHFKATEQSEA